MLGLSGSRKSGECGETMRVDHLHSTHGIVSRVDAFGAIRRLRRLLIFCGRIACALSEVTRRSADRKCNRHNRHNNNACEASLLERNTMKLTGLLHMTLAYVVTLGVGWITLIALGQSPIWDMFWADIAATVAIFIFSRLYKNSSFYDAY